MGRWRRGNSGPRGRPPDAGGGDGDDGRDGSSSARVPDRRESGTTSWAGEVALQSGSVEADFKRGVRARDRGGPSVTAPSSDRPSRSPLLCHGRRGAVPVGAHPSRSDAVDHPATPEDLPALQPSPSASARRATAGMPTAHRAAARQRGRYGPPGRGTSAVPRVVSTIGTGSAPTAAAAA